MISTTDKPPICPFCHGSGWTSTTAAGPQRCACGNRKTAVVVPTDTALVVAQAHPQEER